MKTEVQEVRGAKSRGAGLIWAGAGWEEVAREGYPENQEDEQELDSGGRRRRNDKDSGGGNVMCTILGQEESLGHLRKVSRFAWQESGEEGEEG